jgi:hypothetical protein
VTKQNQKGLTPALLLLMALIFLLPGSVCHAQREYIGKYDLFTGFSNVHASFVNGLNQPGFGMQAGMVHNRWLATGFDYSIQTGTTNLTPNLLPTTTQLVLAAGLPPGYKLSVPTNIKIQTFTAGPQLTYRRLSPEVLFLHPVLSAFRVSATPRPTDVVSTVVSKMLVPQGTKIDWVGAYGVGGGADLRISKHISARVLLDAAWCHPMNDILANGGWITRVSVGPAFHFGPDILGSRVR